MNVESKTKLAEFSKFTIGHTGFQKAIEIIHQSFEATRLRGEPACAMLLGESGTGKTRICDHVMSEFKPQKTVHDEAGIQTIRPVVYCRIPDKVTVKGVVVALLNTFEAHRSYSSFTSLDYRLQRLLEANKTEFIVLDEWQHTARVGAAATQKSICDWMKVLSDFFKGGIMLSGTPEFEKIIALHPGLDGRFPYRARLEPFSLATPENQGEYLGLLSAFNAEIQSKMAFSDMLALTDERNALAIYVLTKGNLRALRTWLFGALREALERADGNLTRQDLSIAAQLIQKEQRLTMDDPFDLSLANLRKLIMSIQAK